MKNHSQLMILNQKINKFTPNDILLYCPFFFIGNLTFPSSISFPINMEGPKRATTRIGYLSTSTKHKQKNPPKRYNLMTERQLSNNTSNRFKFIMTSTRGKTCDLRRRNGTISLPSGKSKTVDNMLLQSVPNEP